MALKCALTLKCELMYLSWYLKKRGRHENLGGGKSLSTCRKGTGTVTGAWWMVFTWGCQNTSSCTTRNDTKVKRRSQHWTQQCKFLTGDSQEWEMAWLLRTSVNYRTDIVHSHGDFGCSPCSQPALLASFSSNGNHSAGRSNVRLWWRGNIQVSFQESECTSQVSGLERAPHFTFSSPVCSSS